MPYQEFIPQSEQLRKYIECFWTISFSDGLPFQVEDLVLPDGGVEWVFSLGSGFLRIPFDKRKKVFHISQSSLVGPRTKAVMVKQSCENALFVIRFKPFGLSGFGFKACGQLVDKVVDAPSVFGSLDEEIKQLLKVKLPTTARLRALEVFLMQRLSPAKVPDVVPALWNTILNRKGNLSLEDFCKHYPLHKSSIQRAFLKHTGVSPKTLMQIIRMNQMIPDFYSKKSLTQICLQYGYYDQSHMIRSLKQLTGYRPLDLRKQDFALPCLLSIVNQTRKQHQLIA